MPLPETNHPINRLCIREEVYNKILTWIMEGVLSPGEKVVDKELALHLGVSRTPVREALRRLEDKGLVESAANRWTRISKIPPQEPEMIYPIIQALEKLALSTAAVKLTDQDLNQMTQANARLKTALEEHDALEASRADDEFHGVFIRQCGNIHLMDILDGLKIRCRRLEVCYFREFSHKDLSSVHSSIQEHLSLVAALRSHDFARAEQILHDNWEKSRDRFRSMAHPNDERETQ